MAYRPPAFQSLPDASLFKFPPRLAPEPIPPLPETASIMHPVNIPDNWFTAALDFRVPVTIALTYAVTVKLLSRYNLSHGKKAWSISKTRPFFAFVVVHNVLLAVYSAWTFWGMLGGMRRSVMSPLGPAGIAGTADSLCHLHGKPGLGNALYWNETTSVWESAVEDNSLVNGIPSSAQMGRLWNEGLAYYGWFFYLSKYYEVLDTFIILAKGKPSSTLQTYHHTGAMLCMWAGMRYMAVPIWIFVQFNSFIHALMYTYYTITAFSIKIPNSLKRSLTSMQITQFLIGGGVTICYSFVSFVVPLSVADIKSTRVASPAVLSGTQPTGTLGAIKQLVFGSADEMPGSGFANATASTHTEYIVQPCIGTSSETFAIWLNVFYLAPLTYLFVSFFITSYLKRHKSHKGISGNSHGHNMAIAEKAAGEAARNIEKEVYGGERMLKGEDSPRSGSVQPTRRRA